MKPTPSRPHAEQVRQLFDAVVDLAPDEQAARLYAIGQENPTLRDEVAALLAAHAGSDDVLQAPVAALRGALLAQPAALNPHALTGQFLDPYLVLEPLGTGGMGLVYKARDLHLDRVVALKVLPGALSLEPAAQHRFIQEARAASRLDHPNILTIYQIGEAESGLLFIAMAFVEGATLKTRVMAEGPLAPDEVVRLGLHMADGLGHAHAAGVVHRDVKPANVMQTADGQVKLLDFGIAKLPGSDLTRTGAQLGTVAYMSPEQVTGRPTDARTDVWSLGVTLYELLTGERPFDRDHEAATRHAIERDAPPPLRTQRPEVPAALATLVQSMLAKDPTDRPPSMAAVADRLRALVRDADAPAPSLPTSPARLSRRMQWVAGLLAVVVAAVALLAWWRAEPTAVGEDETQTLAVLYFENLTGDPQLDWIGHGIAEMLTANLGQFEGVRVLSSQRLFDLLQQVAGPQATRIDRSTATEVARRAGVETMLIGSVLGDEIQPRLSAQLVDVETGTLLGTDVVEPGPDGTLFALADSLTQRVAVHLHLALPGRHAQPSVAYTLTSSPAALRPYVDGLQALYRSNFTEAHRLFEAAIAADSAFALAYYHRGLAHSWQTGEADSESLLEALQHGSRISERERALIEATLTMTADLPTRKTAFERLTAQYPDEKYAWYQLGEIRYHNYWPHAARDAFQQAIDLDPNFLIAYLHPLDVYMHTGAYDDARPLLDRALTLDASNPEFLLNAAFLDYATAPGAATRTALLRRLDQVTGDTTLSPFSQLDAQAAHALLSGDLVPFEQALYAFRAAGHYGEEGYLLATNSLAGLAFLRGDDAAVEALLDEAIRRAPTSPTQRYEDALYHLQQGDAAAALAHARALLDAHQTSGASFPAVEALGLHLLARAHLAAGDTALAEQATEALEQVSTAEAEHAFLLDDARARLALAAGQPEDALRHVNRAQRSVSFTGTQAGSVLLFDLHLHALRLACLEAMGDDEALVEAATSRPLPAYHFHDTNVSTMRAWREARLRLAQAYEALGRTEDAQAVRAELRAFGAAAAVSASADQAVR